VPLWCFVSDTLTRRLPPSHPLAIAHRAGNDPELLGRARAAGVDLLEADVWLFRGRLEVRHRKTMGPVPLLWDRWELARGWMPPLTLAELLNLTDARDELMLDLKGTRPRLSHAIRGALDELALQRPITVCSRNWRLLEPFVEAPAVRVVYSVGSTGQLARLFRLKRDRPFDAISIHQRLLTPAVVQRLNACAGFIMTWPVNTQVRMSELLQWGVRGIISDDLELLRALVQRRNERTGA
jgi:glycerophosphoryl diester phosphodiesterase